MTEKAMSPVTPAIDRGHGDPPAWPHDSARLHPPRHFLPNLLELLREWWRVERKKGWMSPGQPWLFPGYSGRHTSARQLHWIVRLAAARAGHGGEPHCAFSAYPSDPGMRAPSRPSFGNCGEWSFLPTCRMTRRRRQRRFSAALFIWCLTNARTTRLSRALNNAAEHGRSP
jgi:hypothetical protein